MVDIEGILEEVVVKMIGHASRKNAVWLISMDRDCTHQLHLLLPQEYPWRAAHSLDIKNQPRVTT
jgi:hypothetical protein